MIHCIHPYILMPAPVNITTHKDIQLPVSQAIWNPMGCPQWKDEVFIVDMGYEFFLKKNGQDIDKITEIYKDIDVDIESYNTYIELTKPELESLRSVFKNIQSSFQSQTTQFDMSYCISNLINDMKTYIKSKSVVDEITKKYRGSSDGPSEADDSDKQTKFSNIHPWMTKLDTSNGWSWEPTTFLDDIENFATLPSKEDLDTLVSTEKYTLLFVNHYNTALVYTDDYNYQSLCESFPEIQCFTKNITKDISDVFHKRKFTDIHKFKEALDIFTTSVSKEVSIDKNFENRLREYINENYNLSDDVKIRIKSSDLFLEVSTALKKVTPITMDLKWFANFLTTMGLKRKRLAQGHYYYGIQKKNNLGWKERFLPPWIEPSTAVTSELDKVISERENSTPKHVDDKEIRIKQTDSALEKLILEREQGVPVPMIPRRRSGTLVEMGSGSK